MTEIAKIAADERTNSVIVSARSATIETITSLLETLDAPSVQPPVRAARRTAPALPVRPPSAMVAGKQPAPAMAVKARPDGIVASQRRSEIVREAPLRIGVFRAKHRDVREVVLLVRALFKPPWSDSLRMELLDDRMLFIVRAAQGTLQQIERVLTLLDAPAYNVATQHKDLHIVRFARNEQSTNATFTLQRLGIRHAHDLERATIIVIAADDEWRELVPVIELLRAPAKAKPGNQPKSEAKTTTTTDQDPADPVARLVEKLRKLDGKQREQELRKAPRFLQQRIRQRLQESTQRPEHP